MAPSDVAQEPFDLEDLIPQGIFVGTSLIIGRGGLLLYGMRPPKEGDPGPFVELTGIGGALERHDPDPCQGAQREAQEEIGNPVHLLDSVPTWVVRGRGEFEALSLKDGIRPLALVFRHFRTPPHRPWHPDHRGLACLVVYRARLLAEPVPTGELPALAWLRPSQVLATSRADVPLSTLREGGATLIESVPGVIPGEALVRMTDSQEALALAMGDQALALFRQAAERGSAAA